jgi:hypothetical protein
LKTGERYAKAAIYPRQYLEKTQSGMKMYTIPAKTHAKPKKLGIGMIENGTDMVFAGFLFKSNF